MAKTPPDEAQLLERQDLTSSLAIFKFKATQGVQDYQSGQFVTLGLPDEDPEKDGKIVWRAYSIAGPPEEKGHYELYIRLAERPVPGKLTTMIWKLNPGDNIQLRHPKGAFTISHEMPDGSPDNRRIVMIGGGTGLAPFISAAKSLKAQGCKRELVICHGASYVSELGYADELKALAAESEGNPDWNLHYLPAISRPQEEENAGWEGQTGRVESFLDRDDSGTSVLEKILGEALTPENTVFHICGFDGTIQAVLGAFEGQDFRTRKNKREDGSFEIKYESYG